MFKDSIYHTNKTRQQDTMSIFSQLPNNLIMDIIREVDGGLNTHKINMLDTLTKINNGDWDFLNIERPSWTIEQEEEEYGDELEEWREEESKYYDFIDGTGWWGDGETQFKPSPRYTPPPLP